MKNEEHQIKVIRNVKHLKPSDGSSLNISTSRNEQALFNSDTDLKYVDTLIGVLTEKPKTMINPTQLTLIAEVESIDFKKDEYRAKIDDLQIKGNLSLNLLDVPKLMPNPMMEINGIFKVDDTDVVRSMQQEISKRFINTEPIEITEFMVDNERVRSNPPLKIRC